MEDEYGNELQFRYLTNPSNAYRKRAAELIQKDLSEIGIELVFDYDIPMGEEDSLEV